MRLPFCAKNQGKQREEETAIITKSFRGWMIRTTPCHLPRFSPSLFQTNTPSTSQSPSSKHSTPGRISHHRNHQDTRINTPQPPPGTLSPSALVVETGTCASRTLAQRIHRATYPHPHPHFPLPLFISHLVMLKSVLAPQLFELPFAATTLPQLFYPLPHGLSSSACSACFNISIFEGWHPFPL